MHHHFIVFLFFTLGICFILLGVCLSLSEQNLYFDNVHGYECGFDPFSDARDNFYINFYLVSILFLLFDVELVFFLPWLLCQQYIYIYGYFYIFIFFFLLFIGFAYEWRNNALDWDEF